MNKRSFCNCFSIKGNFTTLLKDETKKNNFGTILRIKGHITTLMKYKRSFYNIIEGLKVI